MFTLMAASDSVSRFDTASDLAFVASAKFGHDGGVHRDIQCHQPGELPGYKKL